MSNPHTDYIDGVKNGTIIEAAEYNLLALLRPAVSIDGNKWCVLYGEDLQNGVAGFGDSPYLAMLDFNAAWQRKLAPATPTPDMEKSK